MKVIESVDREGLEELARLVDVAEGYPKLGRNAATGELVQPPPGRPIGEAFGATLRHADILDHPNGNRYGYPVDEVSRPRIAAIKAAIAAKVTSGQATPREAKIHALGNERDTDDTWKKKSPRE